MFLNYRFVPRQLFCVFIIIVRALSVLLVTFSFFSVSLQLICRLIYYMFIKHVSSPLLTVFYCFIGLHFVEWDSVFNCKLIYNETDLNA